MTSLPPPPDNSKKSANTKKADLPVFAGSQSQTASVVSNNDILSLIKQVRSQMDEQKKTNQFIFRELEEIRNSREPVEEFTPVVSQDT